mgnify:CR=1 FL=1
MALLIGNLLFPHYKQVTVLHTSAGILEASQHISVEVANNDLPNLFDAWIADRFYKRFECTSLWLYWL